MKAIFDFSDFNYTKEIARIPAVGDLLTFDWVSCRWYVSEVEYHYGYRVCDPGLSSEEIVTVSLHFESYREPKNRYYVSDYRGINGSGQHVYVHDEVHHYKPDIFDMASRNFRLNIEEDPEISLANELGLPIPELPEVDPFADPPLDDKEETRKIVAGILANFDPFTDFAAAQKDRLDAVIAQDKFRHLKRPDNSSNER
jgi:hypothetical protein